MDWTARSVSIRLSFWAMVILLLLGTPIAYWVAFTPPVWPIFFGTSHGMSDAPTLPDGSIQAKSHRGSLRRQAELPVESVQLKCVW